MNRVFFLLINMHLFLQLSSYSQESSNQRNAYYYSVENVINNYQLELVKREFELLKFVEKVELMQKEEIKTRAQFIIYVNEPKMTKEGQVMFELIDLKKILLKNNLSPTDLEIESY